VQSLLYHAKPFLNPQGFGNFISCTQFFAPIELTLPAYGVPLSLQPLAIQR